MENPKKIRVLWGFNPYLRILKAFNADQFDRSDRNRFVENVWFASGVAMFAATIPIITALAIWFLYDKGATMQIAVAVIPPTLTLLQLLLTFSILIKRNQEISELLRQIRNVIDQRRYSAIFCVVFLSSEGFPEFLRKSQNYHHFGL